MMEKRSYESELIDLGPAYYTSEEYRDCLSQLDRIGRFLGGDAATFSAFDQLESSPLSILDVGCGGGIFTARLAKKYPEAKVVGSEISKEAFQFANEHSHLPHLEFHLSPKPELDYSQNEFDVVTSTLVCHHLNDQELISFLKQANHVAKKAVILNDLHRHPLALFGFSLVASILFNNRLVRHDGGLSIRRAFTKRDWIHYLQEAGIPPEQYTITWHWAFRWIVKITK
jgi:2-polyprenyl-3-methyl-5-hydroxy-6-metoxy-1,4-benzoquinol methylase